MRGSVQVVEVCVSYNYGLEIGRPDKEMADAVILHCKNIFSRHGIPDKVVINNGLQFDSNASVGSQKCTSFIT